MNGEHDLPCVVWICFEAVLTLCYCVSYGETDKVLLSKVQWLCEWGDDDSDDSVLLAMKCDHESTKCLHSNWFNIPCAGCVLLLVLRLFTISRNKLDANIEGHFFSILLRQNWFFFFFIFNSFVDTVMDNGCISMDWRYANNRCPCQRWGHVSQLEIDAGGWRLRSKTWTSNTSSISSYRKCHFAAQQENRGVDQDVPSSVVSALMEKLCEMQVNRGRNFVLKSFRV